jgi:hypothetical protein
MRNVGMTRTLLVGVALLCCAAWASGQAGPHLSADELRQVRLPDVSLEKVETVTPDARQHPGAAAHVRVLGVIGGHIRFELLLPDNWNQRFVMGGGGGFVGSIQNGARDSVNRGYATVGTDTGHESNGVVARWAQDNPEAQVNFGFLAVHRTAQVAQALVRAYYHADPAYSYFVGCSRGGGQAMMESQRYPGDFDGIVAGAPAFNWTGFAAMSVSIAKALYPDPAHLDHTVLDRDALQKLRRSILDQCDAQDGLKDGIVADPPSAHFDLAKVPGLTDAQRQAIAAIYGGARVGHTVLYPGYSPGAECDVDQWTAWIVGPVPSMVQHDHAPDLMFGFGTQVFKYFVFDRPDWDYSTYDLAHYSADTHFASSVLNATNPDLDAFKARKGKLILWHGWADPALPAQATADYYRQVRAHDPAAADYCRLFMIPGCLHCGGGPGASEIDWLSTIADWVEHGKAPDRLVASKHANGKLVMTRPLYPYPEYPIYKGTGDPNNADSFEARPEGAGGS